MSETTLPSSAEAHAGDRPAGQAERPKHASANGREAALDDAAREAIEAAIPAALAGQRWFSAKGQRIERGEILDCAVMQDGSGRARFLLPRVAVHLQGGEAQTYFLPLTLFDDVEEDGAIAPVIARVGDGAEAAIAAEAAASPGFALACVEAMRRGEEIAAGGGGRLRFAATSRMPARIDVAPEAVKRFSGEQSNTSIGLGKTMVLKLYRRLQPGIHPELEMGRFLTDVAGFGNTPPTLGAIEHIDDAGTPTALAILQGYVENQGDAWPFAVDALTRGLETLVAAGSGDLVSLGETFATSLVLAERLGRRTAEMHLASATPTEDADFVVEPFTEADARVVAGDAHDQAERAFASLHRLQDDGGGDSVARLLDRRAECLASIDRLAGSAGAGIKLRVHGDYHLGQVLIVPDDVMIVDFEGEPSRPAADRRAKSSPLRDVAGMLRSFAYAAETGRRDIAERVPAAAERAAAIARAWQDLTRQTFLDAYAARAKGSPIWIDDDASRAGLLRLHLLAKALYEVNYEADNRPAWIETPVRGVLSILEEGSA